MSCRCVCRTERGRIDYVAIVVDSDEGLVIAVSVGWPDREFSQVQVDQDVHVGHEIPTKSHLICGPVVLSRVYEKIG